MTTIDEKIGQTAGRWGFEPPVNPPLPPELRAAFFEEAPAGTVIEVWDDLYRRSYWGSWIHLDDLVYSGGSYSDHRDYNSSTPQEMLKSMESEFTIITVLKLGTEELRAQ